MKCGCWRGAIFPVASFPPISRGVSQESISGTVPLLHAATSVCMGMCRQSNYGQQTQSSKNMSKKKKKGVEAGSNRLIV